MQSVETTNEKLFKLVRLLTRYNHLEEQNAGGGFEQSRGQGRVLSLLELKPGISQSDLAFFLGVRNQSLGEILSKLEKNELIKREQSREDKRVQNITLTDKGVEAARNVKRSDGDRIFEILSEAEEKSFLDVLDKLIEELERELGEDEYFDEEELHSPNKRHIVITQRPRVTRPQPVARPRGVRPPRPQRPQRPHIRVIKKRFDGDDGDIEIDLSKELADISDKLADLGLDEKLADLSEKLSGLDLSEELANLDLDEKLAGLSEKLTGLSEKLSDLGLDERLTGLSEKLADFDDFGEVDGKLVKIIDERRPDGTGKVKKIIINKFNDMDEDED